MAAINLLLVPVGAMIVLAIVSAAELVAPRHAYSWRSRLSGAAFTAVDALLGALLVQLLTRAWAEIGIQPLVSVAMPGAIIGLAAVLIFDDFLAYWNHRFQHRFLWRIHSLHHCQTDLHAANSYAHFTEKGLRFLLLALPLSLIHFGFIGLPFAILMLRRMLENYIHSPTSAHFGPLRKILVDNRFHRIHHSIERRHFDRNFGILFSFWDRLFRTAHQPEADEWPATGVAGVSPPVSLLSYLFFPMRAAIPNSAGPLAPAQTSVLPDAW